MTSNETLQPSSIVGPVRYDLFIPIPPTWAEPSDDVMFIVNGFTLPRVDDDLTFEGDKTLTVKVTKIDHTFFSTTYEAPRRAIAVSAAPSDFSRDLLLKLRDPAELERWVAEFPMLDHL